MGVGERLRTITTTGGLQTPTVWEKRPPLCRKVSGHKKKRKRKGKERKLNATTVSAGNTMCVVREQIISESHCDQQRKKKAKKEKEEGEKEAHGILTVSCSQSPLKMGRSEQKDERGGATFVRTQYESIRQRSEEKHPQSCKKPQHSHRNTLACAAGWW